MQNKNTDILDSLSSEESKDILQMLSGKTAISSNDENNTVTEWQENFLNETDNKTSQDDILASFFNTPEETQETNIDTPTDQTESDEPLESVTPQEEILHYTSSYETASIESSANLLDEIQVIQEKSKPSFWKKVADGAIFFVKYIATSTVIFAVILSASNYHAYIEIAKSYFNPEGLETSRQNMLASVQASAIQSTPAPIAEDTTATTASTTEQQDIQISLDGAQKIEMQKNKTFHSMEKLMKEDANDELPLDINLVPYENRVVIPKIGKNIPLVDVEGRTVKDVKELENVFMNELINGVVRYPWSAKPWNDGNTFIFGHSSNLPWIKGKYNDVFALLDKVNFWDEIIAYYGQKKFTYKITEKKIITPWDVSVLKRDTDKKEITLMTCWPVGTTLNRMIVIWELVETQ